MISRLDDQSGGGKPDQDLRDPAKDQEKLKGEEVTIDLPEVKDIPGQEHVTVPDMREMQDVTISSADEEAEDLLKDVNTDNPEVQEDE